MKEINLIYPAHQGPPSIRYEGPEGKVFICGGKSSKRRNIGLSWYAIRKPSPEDSIFVLEPMCIHPTDYNLSYLSKFSKIFTWANKAFENTHILPNLVPVNHPNIIGKPNPDEFISKWKPWSERKNEAVVIANHKHSQHPSQIYNLRTDLADFIHGEVHSLTMKWYGQSTPNKPYKVGSIEDKIDVLNNVKFTICSENCYDEKYSANYFTEKMMHAWMAGCVPLYMGCHNIDDLFPQTAYIDLRKFVTKNNRHLRIDYQGIKTELENFTEEKYNIMMEEVKKLMNHEEGLFHVCSWDRVCRTMLASF